MTSREGSGDWRDATLAVHAGMPEPRRGEPFLPGPAFASPYHLTGDPEPADYSYNRFGNPTWTRYEEALGQLEGGEVVLFASGMAAVTAVLETLLPPGESGALVAPADAYPGVRTVAAEHLAPRGVEVRLVPSRDEAFREALPGASVLWVESPTNPGLDVCDLTVLAEAAHAEGADLVVDNTLVTPLAQRPLHLGAAFSLASGSKALTGHSDLTMGHVAVRDPERASALRSWRTRTGAVPGPFEVWLAHRSLATLDLRLERSSENALALATMLAERDDVSDVRYPGLPDHPAHQLAAWQMRRFGPVVGFDLGDASRAQAFLDACRLVAEATSFGGVHSTAERRARWGTDAVSEGFIRFSAGCEDPADLVADVARALQAAGS